MPFSVVKYWNTEESVSALKWDYLFYVLHPENFSPCALYLDNWHPNRMVHYLLGKQLDRFLNGNDLAEPNRRKTKNWKMKEIRMRDLPIKGNLSHPIFCYSSSYRKSSVKLLMTMLWRKSFLFWIAWITLRNNTLVCWPTCFSLWYAWNFHIPSFIKAPQTRFRREKTFSFIWEMWSNKNITSIDTNGIALPSQKKRFSFILNTDIRRFPISWHY